MILTPRAVAYVLSEEGLVPEAYKDSATPPVWTWAGGLTKTAGVDVLSYRDNPRPLDECIRATIAHMEKTYLPAVLHAFDGHPLLDNGIAAALSFEWRNGTIGTAQWVKDWRSGDEAAARADFMQWTDHGAETARCKRERGLFFDAQWPNDLRVPVWQVAKPSYRPVHAVPTDIMAILQQVMGGR